MPLPNEPRPATAPLRGSADWRMLWGTGAVSVFGSAIVNFAMPIAVLKISRSIGVASLVLAAGTACSLVATMFGGALVDRVRLKPFMVRINGGRAVLSLVLALAVTLRGSMALAAAAYCAVRAASSLYGPASGALLRDIVPAELRATASSMNHARQGAAAILGPPIGGVVLAASLGAPFAIDAASYIVAALGIWLIKARPAPPPPRSEPYLRAVRSGYRHVFTSGILMRIICFSALITMILPALVVVVNLSLVSQGMSASTVGLIDAIGGAATLIGALGTARIKASLPGRARTAVPMSVCLAGLAVLVVSDSSVPFLFAAMFLIMLPLPVITSFAFAVITQVTPRELQGRVGAAGAFSSTALAPFAPALAAACLALVGDTLTRVILLVTAIVATIVILPLGDAI